MRCHRLAGLGVGVVVLVVACSSSRPASMPTTEAVTTFDCRDPIGNPAMPPDDYQVVGDAVALLTSAGSPEALQTGASGEPDPARRLFAKTGLLVRARARSELIVPPAWSGRLAVAWGNTAAVPTERLAVGPCAGEHWLAYPGGYYVSDPACVEVVVRVEGGVDTTVTVGVGAPCPGQQPPPEPTES